MLQRAVLLVALLLAQRVQADVEEATPATTTSTKPVPLSAATTLETLLRQARSEHVFPANVYEDEAQAQVAVVRRSEPFEQRDSAYYESRCITCDPVKSSVVPVDRE
jgi:hypothetical protein